MAVEMVTRALCLPSPTYEFLGQCVLKHMLRSRPKQAFRDQRGHATCPHRTFTDHEMWTSMSRNSSYASYEQGSPHLHLLVSIYFCVICCDAYAQTSSGVGTHPSAALRGLTAQQGVIVLTGCFTWCSASALVSKLLHQIDPLICRVTVHLFPLLSVFSLSDVLVFGDGF